MAIIASRHLMWLLFLRPARRPAAFLFFKALIPWVRELQIFEEGDTFVAYEPVLDVSRCGGTDEEPRKNIRGALRGFLKTSAAMDTLDELLQEAGYKRDTNGWHTPEFVSVDRLTMSIN